MASARPARDETRQRVLEAAQVAFIEAGYYGTSLNDVARRAGLTKGAIYSNFQNKRALFIESFLESDPAPPPVSPVGPVAAGEVLRSMAVERLPEDNRIPRRAAAMAYEMLTLILRDEGGMELLGEIRVLLSLLISRSLELLAIEQGAPPTVSYGQVADTFVSVIDGARLHRSLDAESLPRALLLDVCAGLAEMPMQHIPLPEVASPVVVERTPFPFPNDIEVLARGLADAGALIVVGLRRLRTLGPLIRLAAAEGVPLTVAVVLAADLGDMAMLVEQWAREHLHLVQATVPVEAHPDLGIIIDLDGTLSEALDVDPTGEVERGFLIEGGAVVGEVADPAAAIVAAAGRRRESAATTLAGVAVA